jgi:hypothetical protein
MRKILLIPGVAIFIVGIIVFASLSQLIDASSTSTGSFMLKAQDEYISNTLTLTRQDVLMLFFNKSLNQSAYLIPASSLGELNRTNAPGLSVMPLNSSNLTEDGLTFSLNSTGNIYNNLTGIFSVAVFGKNTTGVSFYLINAQKEEQLNLDYETIGLSAIAAGTALIIAGTVMRGRRVVK